MNIIVTDNYAKVKPSLLYLPSLILVAVALFLYMNDSLNDNGYAEIQKGVFFWLNSHLSQLPTQSDPAGQQYDIYVVLGNFLSRCSQNVGVAALCVDNIGDFL